MACNIANGRGLECRESIGGIRNVYFANYGDLGNLVVVDNELTNTAATSVYKYELIPQSSSFDEAITVSEENGTVFFEQTLTLALPNLTKTQLKELQILCQGRFQVFVEDNNIQDLLQTGKTFLAGAYNGMTVTGGNVAKGQAFGDMNGYNLTLVGREKEAAYILEGAGTAGDPFSGLTSAITIVTS